MGDGECEGMECMTPSRKQTKATLVDRCTQLFSFVDLPLRQIKEAFGSSLAQTRQTRQTRLDRGRTVSYVEHINDS